MTLANGREHAQLGFFSRIPHLPDTPFILGPITVGDESSVLPNAARPKSAPFAPPPCLIIHTHPTNGNVSSERQASHFSYVDVTQLLQTKHMIASIVVAGENVLLLHKLAVTSSLSLPELAKRQAELKAEAASLARAPGDGARIYTKLARVHFGLSFLIGDLGERILVRKVAV